MDAMSSVTVRNGGPVEIVGDSVEEAEMLSLLQQQIRARLPCRSSSLPSVTGGDSNAKPHPLTSIIVLTHNQFPYTELCLSSLRLYTPQPLEIVVVDNASNDGTVEWLRQQPDVRLIENPINRGFPAGCNQGICAASGEHILLLNNDTIVTPGWLGSLSEVLLSKPEIGLVGPVSNYVSGHQCVPAQYSELSTLEQFSAAWRQKHLGQRRVTDRLVGFCLLFKREVVDKIGLLDERFGLGNFEDDDYIRRAIAAGYSALIVQEAFVHHFGSVSFGALGSGVRYPQFLENHQRFEEKYANQTPSIPPLSEDGRRGEVATCPSSNNTHGIILPSTQSPLVSLCMIVRDNESTIGPCLESIRPWVDEMIVVDTGSVDRTPEIAKRLGAQLHRFPWTDSFSEARNESLRHAHGRWLFWMDSDDTINATNGRKLRMLVESTQAQRMAGYVMQVHCPGPGEDGKWDVTVVDQVKLFPNDPRLRFEGRIHEQILPALKRLTGQIEWTEIYLVHSGYDHSPQGQERKKKRDLRLLELELADQPGHPFTLFNLGMTYSNIGRHQEAINALRQSIAASHFADSHVRKAYAILVFSLKESSEHDAAMQVCQEALRLFPDDLELRFRRGVLLQGAGRLREAADIYQAVLDAPLPQRFGSIDRAIRGFKTRQNLAILYAELGELANSERQWREIVKEAPTYRPGWRGLGNVLLCQHRHSEAQAVARQLLAQQHLEAEGRMLLARAAQASGDLRQAQTELERAAEATDDPEPLRRLCELLFEHADFDVTERGLLRLASRDPADPAPLHNLGTLCLRVSRFRQAVTWYRQAIQLRPMFAQSWLYLGCALKGISEFDEAASAWQEALRLSPQSQEAAAAQECLNQIRTSSEQKQLAQCH